MVEVSSLTGEGLDDLVKTLNDLVKRVPEKEKGVFFRLPVDRVFTIKGFGTVVTGTTISGTINIGEEVTIYPSEIDSKVRGIQVHNRKVTRAKQGLRTAINLQGVEKEQIKRGDVIGAKHSLRTTKRLDAEIILLESAPSPLKNRTKVRFHAGTSEILSNIILLEKEELNPGQSCLSQIVLDYPTVVLKGDRFILRSYSPVRTIGGGIVLNAFAKKKKRLSNAVVEELKVLKYGDSYEIITKLVHLNGPWGASEDDISLLSNQSKDELKGILEDLEKRGVLVKYDPENYLYVHKKFADDVMEQIINYVQRYHEEYPLRKGISKEELRARIKTHKNDRLFQYGLDELMNKKAVIQENNIIRAKEHQVKLGTEHEKIRQDIETTYEESGLQVPYFREFLNKYPGPETTEILNLLLSEGILIKVKDDLYFHKSHLNHLKERLISFLEERGQISTSEFKDLTGVSRKYAIPLIEYFDREKITVRVGDKRIPRKK